MRTILNKPIFINPQAYYVFPLLYDMEGEGDGIELAKYTGTIKVDSSNGDTREYTNTNEIDLRNFIGSIITISQYTKLGAVVLGRWNLGDVLPSWVKDSMEFWYDVKKLKATNESLSANPQLTDFSGNDRPLLLYNFAFSGMSGVNGYDTDFRNWIKNDNFQQYSQYISDNKIILSKYQGNGYIIRLNTDVESFKINVTGIDKIGIAYIHNNIDGTSNTVSITKDGVYTLQKSYAKENNPTGFSYAYNPDLLKTETNITIELIPNYPDALVTDGVDDYGVVLNMDYGVKTLFYVFTSKSYKMNNYIYDQRPSRFQIFTGISDYICYRVNENTVTYLNGKLNKEINTLEIVNIKHIATIVAPSDDYDSSQPYFFRSQSGSNLGECAFYSAIGFNRVLTQEEIDWVIENMIDKTDIDMNLIPTE